VEVTFRKAAHRKDFPVWVAKNGKSTIRGAGLGSDPRHLPHDIVTLVVERELGLAHGFFGTVAAGGTFRSMDKRRHADGKAAIARNRPSLDEAERLVNREWSAWLANDQPRCAGALDAALAAWRAVPPGGELTLQWLPARRRVGRRS
jgi:hypothetical protein